MKMVARTWTMRWLTVAAFSLMTLIATVNAADKTAERSETEDLLRLLRRLQTDLKERGEDPSHQDEIDGQSRETGKANRNVLGHTGKLGRDTGVDDEHLLMGRIGKLGRDTGVDGGRSGKLGRGGVDGERTGKLGRDTGVDGGRTGKLGRDTGVDGERTGKLGRDTGVDGGRSGKLGRDTGVDDEHLLMGRIGKLGRGGVDGERTGKLGRDTGVNGERSGVDGERTGKLGRDTGVDDESVGKLGRDTGVDDEHLLMGHVGKLGRDTGVDGERTGKLGREQFDDKSLLMEGRLTKAVGTSSDPAGPILQHVMELLVTLLNDSLNLTLSHASKSNEVVERRKREADDGDSSSSPSGNPLVYRMLQELGELNYYLVAYDVLTMYPPSQQQQRKVTKASRSAAETLLGQLGVSRIQLSDDAPVDENLA